MGTGVVHERGKRHEAGDCMYAVIESEEVSAGIANLISSYETDARLEIKYDGLVAYDDAGNQVVCVTSPRVATEERGPCTCDSCTALMQVTADRDALLRMVEQLLEQDVPCVDTSWYSKRLQEIKRRR